MSINKGSDPQNVAIDYFRKYRKLQLFCVYTGSSESYILCPPVMYSFMHGMMSSVMSDITDIRMYDNFYM